MNSNTKNLPLVVIFGRTNVGKSTLFNCLIEKRKALVSNIEGTTRDSNIGEVEWDRKKFALIDTGGIIDMKYLTQKISGKKKIDLGGKTDNIDAKVQEQAREYIMRADLILFLVDVKDGLLPQDRQMATVMKKILLENKKLDTKEDKSAAAKIINEKIILVVNKADNPRIRREAAEFNRLGLGEPLAISATTGSGTGDLLDKIVDQLRITNYELRITDKDSIIPKKKSVTKKINAETSYEEQTEIRSEAEIQNLKSPSAEARDHGKIQNINVCIVGKPNVGKSSLINKLLGEDKFIVSSTPHTTREPQDITVTHNGQEITFVDTAGLSRKGQKNAKQLKTKQVLEKLSISKSLHALGNADIALLVIDLTEPIGQQETKIVDEIMKKKASLIIIANKWDLVEEKDTKKYTSMIYADLPFITWAPIHFCSAFTGEKVGKIFDLILKINEERNIELNENILGKFLDKIIKRHRPTKGRGVKYPRIHNFKQIKRNPPVFSIRVGTEENLSFSYVKYMENRLREKFGFLGTPISIWVERNKKIHGRAEDQIVKGK